MDLRTAIETILEPFKKQTVEAFVHDKITSDELFQRGEAIRVLEASSGYYTAFENTCGQGRYS